MFYNRLTAPLIPKYRPKTTQLLTTKTTLLLSPKKPQHIVTFSSFCPFFGSKRPVTTTAHKTLKSLKSPSFVPLPYKSSLNTIAKFTFTTTTTSYFQNTAPAYSEQQLPQSHQRRKLMEKEQRKAFLESNLKITHDRLNSRFIVSPEDLNSLYPEDGERRTEESAKLLYVITTDEKSGKKIIDFTSTYCPVPFRGGTGISEYLVETGLTWATAEGYQIKAACWYVDKFLPFTPPKKNESKL